MAKQASIPITDHGDVGVCTNYYRVKYRLTGSTPWSETESQYDTPILINNLDASTEYDYEIYRHCCGGLVSTAATGTFTTSA